MTTEQTTDKAVGTKQIAGQPVHTGTAEAGNVDDPAGTSQRAALATQQATKQAGAAEQIAGQAARAGIAAAQIEQAVIGQQAEIEQLRTVGADIEHIDARAMRRVRRCKEIEAKAVAGCGAEIDIDQMAGG